MIARALDESKSSTWAGSGSSKAPNWKTPTPYCLRKVEPGIKISQLRGHKRIRTQCDCPSNTPE